MYLIAISLAWIAGIFIASKFSFPLSLILTGLLPLSLIFIFRNKARILILMSIILFAFSGAASFYPLTGSGNPEADYPGPDSFAQVRGEIKSQPEIKEKYTYLNLRVNEIKNESGWQPASGTILLLVPHFPEYQYGDLLLVSGLLNKPPVFDDFDYQAYLARKDIYFIIYSPDVEVLERISGFNLISWIFDLRDRLSQSLSTALPEPQASLAQGIILGIRSGIPDSLKTNLSITGSAHLLAISGVNLTIISGLLIALGVWIFGRRYYIYVWFALFIIWFYVVITGIQSPVVRSAIMASVFLFAELLGRQKQAFPALCLSAAIMTATNPHILYDVSFQLTFAAMAGLIFVTPVMQNYIHKSKFINSQDVGFKTRTLNFISDNLCISLGAIIAVWPIIALNFGIFSFISPFSTLLIAPVLSPIIVFGSLTAFTGLFNPTFAQFPGWITWIFLTYMVFSVNILAVLPFAAINLEKLNGLLLFIYYSILLSFNMFKTKINKLVKSLPEVLKSLKNGFISLSSKYSKLIFKLTLIPLLAIAFYTTYAAAVQPDENLHVFFLNVGEGDSILIRNHDQKILIDGGAEGQAVCLELSSKLSYWDRNIDLVILTHPHLDHMGGLIEVLKRYKVKQVLMLNAYSNSPVYLEWSHLLENNRIPYSLARAGQKISLKNEAAIEILNPPLNAVTESDENIENNGIVVRLVKNRISFLLTADIENSTEQRMIENRVNLKSTVLKVAHHGSATSTSPGFLDVCRPEIAVISAGAENQFGHPDEQVLKNLTSSLGSDKRIYRTDKSGTIEFATDGEKLWVKTEK